MNQKKKKRIKKYQGCFFSKYGSVIVGTLLLSLMVGTYFYVRNLDFNWERLIISEQEKQKIMEECVENTSMIDAQQIDLMLNGVKLPRDVSSNLYYLSQNVDVKEWEGILSTGSDAVKLYLLEDSYFDNKEKAIEEGHIFQVLLKKGKEYALTNLVASGMPVINIDTEYSEEPGYTEEDIDNFVFNNDTRYYGDITVFRADGSSGTYTPPELRDHSTAAGLSFGKNTQKENYRIVQKRVSYHDRGATSAHFDKKGYALKLLDQNGKKEAECLLNLGYSSKWKLLSIPADHYKIREKTAWQIWCEIAEQAKGFKEYTSTMEYCELVVDGEYRGLFCLLKTFDEDSLSLDKNDVLYKIIQAEMPTKDEIEASVAKDYPVCYPIRMRYPEPDEIEMEDAWRPMKEYLDAALWHTNFDTYYQTVEMDNLLDYMIFLECTTASDNSRKNTYMVADYQPDGSYKMLTLPWDLDNTFGNNYDNDMSTGKTKYNPDTSVIYTEGVTRQLILNDEHGEKKMLLDKWTEYRRTILSDEHILSMMQQNMDYLLATGAFARDEKRWPEFGHESDLTQIKEYQKDRMAFLDDYFANF